ncbi:hypothetical protein HHK36_011305 [Tetracentron sinense]|uniref:Cytochrome P450 n=1 Tax=Tetracentron sinense TaxID=13715 RepID=A0A834ZG22_TETSI|nr:hypothetical protein HHK36_011305 [Tetracentron sinense]
MSKVKSELDQIVGRNKEVEEDHIEDLHYLQAVVKEALRLHPPVPFLVPRKAVEDVNFIGYSIPKDTQFIPFGAGRRMCAGILLGHRMLHLTLGSLLHSFDWVLEDIVTLETLDMKERTGISLRKAIPLKALPKPRSNR